ncbi:lytic murein transglycosylase, soluble [Candidatus Thiomargarita nelsonii]|uniref:Lytic murein transglycosylase, soluble n=1 Tax=Candidatus Thiomargarita nelsonii TaxID=1003181 RepID=A0A176S6A2_9GAMM|nr:lytic murein transglycosylase, soluble [Candidatus Thiomargarita nelsonii]
MLASHWEWHDQAIMAAAKAGYYDDLDVRFPLAFKSQLTRGAKRQGIDLAWVYGIVRQETAFRHKARSSAGALGLMQVMPATARFVAKKIDLKLKRRQDILDIDTNIKLGTAYLQQMLDKFDGNYMLATAAYNAGPGRSKRWAAENSCVPADLWVELIPFNETRKYVRSVLFYTRIFEERLQRKRLRPLRVTLAGKGNWKGFMQDYTPLKSTSMQCLYTYARLMTKQKQQGAIKEAKKLWLVGKSQPHACTPLFDYLYQGGLIDKSLLWERIGLAMKKGRLSLASFLAKRLEPADRVWVTRWQTMHKKPARSLARFKGSDLPVVRQIILHGIGRLVRQDFERAQVYWKKFQRRYAFSVQEIGEMQRDLALASVNHDHPQALKWLTAVNQKFLNKKVSDARIKLALKKQNWHALADFLTELPDGEENKLQWRYWLARALEQTGKKAQAR